MEFKKRVRTKTISAKTDYEFDMQFAQAMEDIEQYRGSVKDIHWLGDNLHCIVVWDTTIAIPQTPREEHEVEDTKFKCHECKCYVPSTDGRIKYTRCSHGAKCSRDEDACDWFYEMLDNCEDILVKSPSVVRLRGVI